MAPRNNDENASYKKKNFPVDDDMKNVVPCLLHKKHKVVKLVKSQIQKIQEEGMLCPPVEYETEVHFMEDAGRLRKDSKSPRQRRSMLQPEGTQTQSGRGCLSKCLYLLAFLVSTFVLVLLMVWISAGPLSNRTAHTPIPSNSFVRTDSLCTLEKKYLQRWSKPEYFE